MHKIHGRKEPYTVIGLHRLPCVKCGAPARFQWQICSDNRLFRPLCKKCDVELNEMVMRWAFGDTREEDLAAYRERVL
jgi:hypothetical protein